MDYEKQINNLAGETLALQIIVTSICDRLCEVSPLIFQALTTAFEDAAGHAENVAINLGKSAAPEHTLKALRIIEEIRAIAIRDNQQPRHGV